jgi:hypothetical protein
VAVFAMLAESGPVGLVGACLVVLLLLRRLDVAPVDRLVRPPSQCLFGCIEANGTDTIVAGEYILKHLFVLLR